MSSCCGGDGRRLSHKYRYLDPCCWRLVIAITVVVVVSLTTHFRSNVKVVQAWTATPSCNRNSRICYSDKWNRRLPPPPQTVVRMMADSDIEDVADVDVVDDDDSIGMSTSSVSKDMKLMERVWRYNKKPLLSIGAQKGPTVKHGNSLRELLNHHTTVKVKIQLLLNSSSRNNDAQTMEDQMIQVYHQLKDYAVVADPTLHDMELLQVRVAERILLVGLPGTRQKIVEGTYPPPPPPPTQNVTDDQ